MADFSITIGNKNYSSWSLRGWLSCKLTGADFDEHLIPLDLPETRAAILARSPSGLVPALHHGDLTIHDSLAIGEYLNELYPGAGLWPEDRAERAMARSYAAEMHSGFMALRAGMSMDMRRTREDGDSSAAIQKDIARISKIWEDCLERSGGPFLFGAHYCITDAFYAPVVSRFRTYDVPLTGMAAAYAEAAWDYPAVQEWYADAVEEPWDLGDDH